MLRSKSFQSAIEPILAELYDSRPAAVHQALAESAACELWGLPNVSQGQWEGKGPTVNEGAQKLMQLARKCRVNAVFDGAEEALQISRERHGGIFAHVRGTPSEVVFAQRGYSSLVAIFKAQPQPHPPAYTENYPQSEQGRNNFL